MDRRRPRLWLWVAAAFLFAPHAGPTIGPVLAHLQQAGMFPQTSGLPKSQAGAAGVRNPAPAWAANRAIAFARAQIGKPYEWGGTGPRSWDCSGLTQAAWRAAGVNLPRTAAEQYAATRRVPLAQARPGDLTFYATSGRSGWHEALVLGRGLMLEAPFTGANVRIVPLRTQGLRGVGRP